METIRVQRKRTKGFKLPENTICVNRPTLFGNPFSVEKYGRGKSVALFKQIFQSRSTLEFPEDARQDLESSKLFIAYRQSAYMTVTEMAQDKLRGKNLACFCSLDSPCHADVLLEYANPLTR